MYNQLSHIHTPSAGGRRSCHATTAPFTTPNSDPEHHLSIAPSPSGSYASSQSLTSWLRTITKRDGLAFLSNNQFTFSPITTGSHNSWEREGSETGWRMHGIGTSPGTVIGERLSPSGLAKTCKRQAVVTMRVISSDRCWPRSSALVPSKN